MKNERLSILVVEDDSLLRLTLSSRLAQFGVVEVAETAEMAQKILERKKIDLALIDLDLEKDLIGLDVLKKAISLNVYSVILTGRHDKANIEKCYQLGANAFLVKPYDKETIQNVVNKFLFEKNQSLSLNALKHSFLTNDLELERELKSLSQIFYNDLAIFIQGETGTGKTHMAKFIHGVIGKDKPFVHFNCAEISENLLESELFGHEKGAFTGAIKPKKGLLELADGGVLFMDEVGTLPVHLQTKLLKAIDEKTFYPVGSERPVRSNFRLISATCDNIQEKIESNKFRQDFFFRIKGLNFTLKPLRMRIGDIELLIEFFMSKTRKKFILAEDAIALLKNYSWPGNIRELEKCIHVLSSLSEGIVRAENVKDYLKNDISEDTAVCSFDINRVKEIGLNKYIEAIETEILSKVMMTNQHHVRKTINDLQISSNSFYRIISNHQTAYKKQRV